MQIFNLKIISTHFFSYIVISKVQDAEEKTSKYKNFFAFSIKNLNLILHSN